MDKCIILFLLSMIIWLIAKVVKTVSGCNHYVVNREEKKFIRFCELLNLFLESVAITIFYTTLIFAIYIFTFNY